MLVVSMCRYYKKVLRFPLVTYTTKTHPPRGDNVGLSISWAFSQLIALYYGTLVEEISPNGLGDPIQQLRVHPINI